MVKAAWQNWLFAFALGGELATSPTHECVVPVFTPLDIPGIGSPAYRLTKTTPAAKERTHCKAERLKSGLPLLIFPRPARTIGVDGPKKMLPLVLGVSRTTTPLVFYPWPRAAGKWSSSGIQDVPFPMLASSNQPPES